MHSLYNINGTLAEIDRYPNIDFELIISKLGGAFGKVFLDYFDIEYPKNIKKISYTDKSIPIDKFTLSFDPTQLTAGSIHYVFRCGGNFSYCRLNKVTMEKIIEKIYNLTEHLDFDNLIGVHFRNTDYRNDICNIVEQTEQLKTEKDLIFLATDDIDAVKVFKERFGDSLIHLAKLEPITGANFHYCKGIVTQNEKLLDCLIDLYILVKAKKNIYSKKTSWSRFIPVIKKHNIIFGR